jgi:myo-inositol-1-phosphate synthase
MEDIETFQGLHGVSRMVMLWCGSTEIFMELDDVHKTRRGFEGAPNLSVDIPALHELAMEKGVPICGKDFKTGQTLLKTIIAPGLKARMLGVHGTRVVFHEHPGEPGRGCVTRS